MKSRSLSGALSSVLIGLVTILWVDSPLCAFSQGLRVSNISLDSLGQVHVRHESQTNFYYILYQGTNVTDISTPAAMVLGASGSSELIAQTTSGQSAIFFRVRQLALDQPLDTDQDGINDVL
jgi:hypothetical protein